jgi:hypothetical protein
MPKKSSEEVKQIRARLEEEYSKSAYNAYVQRFATSNLKVMQMFGKRFTLNSDESLDDLCISVSLKKEPPKELELYSEFEGVRVFYEKATKYTARPAYPSEEV